MYKQITYSIFKQNQHTSEAVLGASLVVTVPIRHWPNHPPPHPQPPDRHLSPWWRHHHPAVQVVAPPDQCLCRSRSVLAGRCLYRTRHPRLRPLPQCWPLPLPSNTQRSQVYLLLDKRINWDQSKVITRYMKCSLHLIRTYSCINLKTDEMPVNTIVI